MELFAAERKSRGDTYVKPDSLALALGIQFFQSSTQSLDYPDAHMGIIRSARGQPTPSRRGDA